MLDIGCTYHGGNRGSVGNLGVSRGLLYIDKGVYRERTPGAMIRLTWTQKIAEQKWRFCEQGP